MTDLHQGSCHCGAVRFECRVDLKTADTTRCDCSICRKARFWKVIVPSDAFRLLAGAEHLSDYRFGNHAIAHRFCRHCGVKLWGEGNFPPIGPFHAVNVACLDDVEPEQFAALSVRCEDGRNNAWDRAPEFSSYL